MARGIGEVMTVQMIWTCVRCGREIKAGERALKLGAVEFACEVCPKSRRKPAATQTAMW